MSLPSVIFQLLEKLCKDQMEDIFIRQVAKDEKSAQKKFRSHFFYKQPTFNNIFKTILVLYGILTNVLKQLC